MQNIPNIVRERLQAAKPADAHPDADLLTAFAEKSLPEAERAVVFGHLARCGDCREIVALALPATEIVDSVPARTRNAWFTWPVLRWGVVAAGVVIIASLGILQYQRRSSATEIMAYKSQNPQVAVPEATRPGPPAAAPAPKPEQVATTPGFADSVSGTRSVDESKQIARATPPSAPAPANSFRGGTRYGAAGGSLGGPLPHGPDMPSQFLNNNSQQQAANNSLNVPTANQPASGASAAKRIPGDNETVTMEVSGEAPVVNTESSSLSAKTRDQSASAQNEFADKIGVSKSKLPVPPASGQIRGYVVDPSGAAVSNAHITVTPTQTGEPATAVTDSQGQWLIAGLSTGNYKAQAEAPGFKTNVLDFRFDADRPSLYSFTLSPGNVSETVEVTAQNEQVQADTASIGGVVANSDLNQLPVNGRNVGQLVTLSPASAPRWTISSGGALQRSVDQGKSWQTVDVNASVASTASFEIVTASRAKELSKEKDSSDRKKQQAPTPIFRAVTAAGSEVWVGGSAGALYHSVDAGGHWTRVVPSSAGTLLSGDIVSLEFPDPQHGKLTTSTPEVWTTSDAGQTWQKQ
jgi:hypothetical protein